MNLNYLLPVSALLLLLCGMARPAWAGAANTNALDCISLQRDFSEILAAKDNGRYRYANEVKVAEFSYQIDQAYSDYLAYAEQVIAGRNPKADLACPIDTPVLAHWERASGQQDRTYVRQLVAPFELVVPDSRKAIVLIHGLTDSPFVFHDLAAFFYQQGLTVRTLLLPGHGTAPSDLIAVQEQQWRQAAHYAIERTLRDFDEVYLGGFSTGGTLILNELMEQASLNPAIKGVLLWSPASEAVTQSAWLAQYIDWIPLVDWLGKEADVDFAKYESFPLNAAAQVYALMQRLGNSIQEQPERLKNVPLFVVASQVDQTIDTDATLQLFSRWHDPNNRTATQFDTFVYYGDAQHAKAWFAHQPAVTFIVPTCLGEPSCERIEGIAHTALTNSPLNAHYGVQGVYRNCNHYQTDDKAYKACKTSPNVRRGETSAAVLAASDRPLQRLTYNPYFLNMLEEIKRFLVKTEAGASAK